MLGHYATIVYDARCEEIARHWQRRLDEAVDVLVGFMKDPNTQWAEIRDSAGKLMYVKFKRDI